MTGEFRPEAILELLGSSSALQASATIYRDLDGAWAAYAGELVGEQRNQSVRGPEVAGPMYLTYTSGGPFMYPGATLA